MPIQSFRDRRCERIFTRQNPGKGFPADLARVTQRKLLSLDRAATLDELGRLGGNHLEALRGDRVGQHSIRVNDQYRICFVWTDDGRADVEFVDYH